MKTKEMVIGVALAACLSSLAEDLRGVWGLAFVAGPAHGDFDLTLDEVRIE